MRHHIIHETINPGGTFPFSTRIRLTSSDLSFDQWLA